MKSLQYHIEIAENFTNKAPEFAKTNALIAIAISIKELKDLLESSISESTLRFTSGGI